MYPSMYNCMCAYLSKTYVRALSVTLMPALVIEMVCDT